MPVSFKVLVLTLIAFVLALECWACRFTRPLDPEDLEADLVVHGQLTFYTHPSVQLSEQGPYPKYLYGVAVLCVRTLETYLGEEREEWCFYLYPDIGAGTPQRDWMPDDVIVAANTLTPRTYKFLGMHDDWLAPLDAEKSLFNAGCTPHYLIPFSEKAEQDMIERLVRLGLSANESPE